MDGRHPKRVMWRLHCGVGWSQLPGFQPEEARALGRLDAEFPAVRRSHPDMSCGEAVSKSKPPQEADRRSMGNRPVRAGFSSKCGSHRTTCLCWVWEGCRGASYRSWQQEDRLLGWLPWLQITLLQYLPAASAGCSGYADCPLSRLVGRQCRFQLNFPSSPPGCRRTGH